MPTRFERDAEVVRSILDKHLGHHAHPFGLYPADLAVNDRLLDCGERVPRYLSQANVRQFVAGLGVTPSAAYVRRFRDVAITLCCGRHDPEPPIVAEVASHIRSTTLGEAQEYEAIA